MHLQVRCLYSGVMSSYGLDYSPRRVRNQVALLCVKNL